MKKKIGKSDCCIFDLKKSHGSRSIADYLDIMLVVLWIY